MSQELPRRRGRPPVIAVPPDGARIIKKYGNRRLYDTRESRYVNQEALLNLFAREDDLKVLDASSGEDLTERVLAQAILGEDTKRTKPLIPAAVLRALARFRGKDRPALEKHLIQAVTVFAAARPRRRPARPARPAAPAAAARATRPATRRPTAARR